MSRELSAYRIDLQLYERDGPDDDWNEAKGLPEAFITISTSLDKASEYVVETWMKEDQTDRAQFEYRAVSGCKIPGKVLL